MNSALKAYRQTQRDQLILDNLDYVPHVIHRLLARLPEGVDLENLQQAGVYGLIEAAEQFEPRGDTQFTTFAYPRIIGAVIDELRRNSPLPQEMLRRVRLVEQALEVLSPPVSVEAISKQSGLSKEEVESAIEARRLTANAFLEDEMIPTASPENSSPDAAAEWNERKHLLASGIKELPEQQRLVLTMYYLDDMRLKEIADVMNLSESRISRVLSQAEFRLREFVRSKEE